jgi:tetratricopeptide (TPR) repeat protein
MYDSQGLVLSSSHPDAVRAYNNAVTAFMEYRTSTTPLLKETIEFDPDFCMAHCLRGYLFMVFGTFAVLDKARDSLANAERTAASGTDREKRHVAALKAWVEGDLVKACVTWETLLFQYPLDLLALRLHHFNNFWMGRARGLRSMPAAVLPSWNETIAGYGNVLGMLAFGYEENGEYALAERNGRKAVEYNPNDLWALHAVAHVLEMQGRLREGEQWLARPVDHWDDRNPFKRHLWWHLALVLIEDGRHDEALALYDRSVAGGKSDFYLDIQNAASLLVRLEFAGLDAGSRWQALADHAETHKDDHALVFTDVHCVMSLAHEKRFIAAKDVIDSMSAYMKREANFTADVIHQLGIPLCEGIIAFEQGRYDDAIDLFLPLRHVTTAIGASHAQRDIFDQYLIEAALRGNRDHMAQALLQQRSLLKPTSKETLQKQARLAVASA